MGMSPRIHRRAAWCSLTTFLAIVLAASWSGIWPVAIAAGRFGTRVDGRSVEIVRCSHPVGWKQGTAGPGGPPGARSYWTIAAGGGWAAIVDGPGNVWRPDWRTDHILIGSSPKAGTLITFWHVFVPVWPLALLAGAAAGALWWKYPTSRGAGMCPACGYDVRGVRGGRCPECGGVVARMAVALRRACAWPRSVLR